MNYMHINDTTTLISLYLAPIMLILSPLSHFRPDGRRACYLLNIVQLELDID